MVMGRKYGLIQISSDQNVTIDPYTHNKRIKPLRMLLIIAGLKPAKSFFEKVLTPYNINMLMLPEIIAVRIALTEIYSNILVVFQELRRYVFITAKRLKADIEVTAQISSICQYLTPFFEVNNVANIS
jgi:hypothetical protein